MNIRRCTTHRLPQRGSNPRCGLFAVVLLATMTSIALVGCGSDDPGSDGGLEFDEPPAPEQAVDIDTVVSSTTVTAGEPIDVECIFLDAAGETIEFEEDEAPSERILQFPDDGFETNSGELIATRAGDAKLACQSHGLGLTDSDPVDLTVEPGPAHTTAAQLSDHQITAGDTIEATCHAYDEFGNTIDDPDVELIADTSSSGIIIDDEELSASITTTGIFTFSCLADDASDRFGDPVEVLPAKPAQLSADPMPNQEIYGIGQVITIGTHVVDRYGNKISSPQLGFDALPSGDSFGQGRYRFDSEGIYTVVVEVTEDTHDDEYLYDEVEIVVNATGPNINCLAPADGEMVDHTPGEPISFQGTATDAHGTQSIFVNGEEVSLEEGGKKGALDFETTIDTEYGINFVDIEAEDEYGEENVRTCAFLVSDNWAEEDGFLDDAVSLSLFQPAVDDGEFSEDELDSLNDIIMTALNSEGLEEMLEDELTDAGPFDAGTCGADLYIEGIDLQHGPDHITSIDLVDGGISLDATFNEVAIELYINTNFYCPNFRPTAEIAYLDIGLTGDLELSDTNQPSMSLRDGEVDYVNSGDVSLSGSNAFSDLLYSAVDSLFQSTLRGLIEDTFADQIEDVFDDTVGDLLESLDVDSLGTSFDVPSLDSDDTMSLNFDFQFSTIDVDEEQAQFGLAPRLYPGYPNVPDGDSPGHNSLGVAYPSGPMLANHSVPNTTDPEHDAAAGAHVSLLNQALHSLWRGGLFHADVGDALGDELEDVSVELAIDLPPHIILNDDLDDGAELSIGAAHLELVYPGIFDDPVALTAGVVASTGIDLNGTELSFDGVSIDEFYLSPQGISLNAETRDILEDFIQDLLQDIIDESLNAALPSLPIPSFAVPEGMTEFDLPEDGDIGIYDTSATQDRRHLELYGSFGVQ